LTSSVHQSSFVIASHEENYSDSNDSEDHDGSENGQAQFENVIGSRISGKLFLDGWERWEAAAVAEIAYAALNIVCTQAATGRITLLRSDNQIPLVAVQWQVLVFCCATASDSLDSVRISDSRLPAGYRIRAYVISN
jgi:hypothetical protein